MQNVKKWQGESIALCSDDVVAQACDGINIRIVQPQTRVDDCARGNRRGSNDGFNLKQQLSSIMRVSTQ